MHATPRDISFAIRDFLEDQEFFTYNDDLDETGQDRVQFVDVSDPHNPVIHLDNGQTFTCRIIAQ